MTDTSCGEDKHTKPQSRPWGGPGFRTRGPHRGAPRPRTAGQWQGEESAPRGCFACAWSRRLRRMGEHHGGARPQLGCHHVHCRGRGSSRNCERLTRCLGAQLRPRKESGVGTVIHTVQQGRRAGLHGAAHTQPTAGQTLSPAPGQGPLGRLERALQDLPLRRGPLPPAPCYAVDKQGSLQTNSTCACANLRGNLLASHRPAKHKALQRE